MKLPDFNKWFLPITIPIFTILHYTLINNNNILYSFIYTSVCCIISYLLTRLTFKN